MPVEALKDIKALTFDVFGTVFNWRETVESALKESLASKIHPPGHAEEDTPTPTPTNNNKPPPQLPPRRVETLTDEDYATLAQEWRNAYKRFTRGFKAGTTPWKDIDAHHLDSLTSLLRDWHLGDALTPEETEQLSLVWHRLVPWPDSARGIRRLGGGGGSLALTTAALSNGNRSLLADLDGCPPGGLGFSRLLSALDDFGAYKPDPRVYLGAAGKLGVAPGEVAMVAAHLNDLDAARGVGMRTIYVEREGEEDWGVDDERYRAARKWVDLWVGLGEGGFVEVARRLESL